MIDDSPARRDPEEIRRDIEATKDRITESVESLAEVKADLDYAKAHPKEVLLEKVTAAKDDIVQRVQEKKEEITAHHAAASLESPDAGGVAGVLSKAKGKVAGAYEAIESKLDDVLGVDESVNRQAH